MVEILKKGVEKERKLIEGESVNFGTDETECEYQILLKEISPIQFAIKNINGNLCIVDRCRGGQLTRIKV